MEYDNTDTGALFKNDKKGNEKAPDYTGEIYDASGNKRRIAAWLKTSSGGKTYMSLKVSDVQQHSAPAPQAETAAPEQPQTSNNTAGGAFDEIPFAPIEWKT